jgi:hypothetical protein
MLLTSDASQDGAPLYRVWIVHYQDWRPHCWSEVPPRYRAVELAVGGCLTHDAAAHWLEGYNAAMLAGDARLWAVAVKVHVRYEGDLVPGQMMSEPRARNGAGPNSRLP